MGEIAKKPHIFIENGSWVLRSGSKGYDLLFSSVREIQRHYRMWGHLKWA